MLGADAMNRRGQMFGEEQASNNVFNQNRNNQFNQLMNRENMRWGQNMDRYNIATEQRAMRLAEQQAQDARKMQAYGMLSGASCLRGCRRSSRTRPTGWPRLT